ncbi:hypothetical protein DFH06DRAFT_1292522 [Mycena polygramma]|nr:hypothetical protein DFH06DRAFT_1292522 [Mycena polygramma]
MAGPEVGMYFFGAALRAAAENVRALQLTRHCVVREGVRFRSGFVGLHVHKQRARGTRVSPPLLSWCSVHGEEGKQKNSQVSRKCARALFINVMAQERTELGPHAGRRVSVLNCSRREAHPGDTKYAETLGSAERVMSGWCKEDRKGRDFAEDCRGLERRNGCTSCRMTLLAQLDEGHRGSTPTEPSIYTHLAYAELLALATVPEPHAPGRAEAFDVERAGAWSGRGWCARDWCCWDGGPPPLPHTSPGPPPPPATTPSAPPSTPSGKYLAKKTAPTPAARVESLFATEDMIEGIVGPVVGEIVTPATGEAKEGWHLRVLDEALWPGSTDDLGILGFLPIEPVNLWVVSLGQTWSIPPKQYRNASNFSEADVSFPTRPLILASRLGKTLSTTVTALDVVRAMKGEDEARHANEGGKAGNETVFMSGCAYHRPQKTVGDEDGPGAHISPFELFEGPEYS